jgi:hypothetical protein
MHTLWIVCPVYFDAESFQILRERIRGEVARLTFDTPRTLRFVAIDDTGGQDPELAAVRALPDVDVIEVPFNLGHQRAIVFGLRKLAGRIDDDDWVVTLDSDGEDQPSDLGRLLEPLASSPHGANRIVLARRTERRESITFRAMYLVFTLMFRLLTGTVIRTGNYAAFRGALTKQVLFHPFFDLSYSSALLSLDLPATFVPCARGRRFAGQSRMGFTKLIMHGLRMLTPFTDRIATRALICFSGVLAAGIVGAAIVVFVRLFTALAIPGWASYILLGMFMISFAALGNFVILFVLFAQSGGSALRGLYADPVIGRTDARESPTGAGRSRP